MAKGLMARSPAPIDYEDLRVRHSTLRGLAAAYFVGVSAYALVAHELVSAWAVLGPALVVLIDALARRTVKSSPVPPLLVDISAIGVAMSLTGASPSVQAAAFIYVMLTALLVLSLPMALLVLIYALAWAAVVAWQTAVTDGEGLFSRLVPAAETTQDFDAAFDLERQMEHVDTIYQRVFGSSS